MKYTAGLTPAKYLSKEEEANLLEVLERYRTKEPRNTTLFMFMLRTGARPGEALGLKWGDIHFTDRSVHLKTLKGGPDRVIPLTDNLVRRLKAMPRGKDDEVVFKVSYPRMVKIWNVYRPGKKKPHSLRHTFAANFYKSCHYNVWLTQQALGHATLSATSVYLQIHSNIEDFRKAIGV